MSEEMQEPPKPSGEQPPLSVLVHHQAALHLEAWAWDGSYGSDNS
jgi:hypothetical protein